MKYRDSLISQGLIFLMTLMYNLWMALSLPATVPTHWNIHNQPDAYGSKWIPVLIMPGIVLFTMLLTLVLPLISPKQFEISRFSGAYGSIMTIVSLMMGGLNFVIMQATAGVRFDVGNVMVGVIFLFFALMGNLMGKVRRNFFMGVRTPWTLADERVWDITHRQAARLWFFGGLVGAVLSFLGAGLGFTMSLMLVISFVPVVNSYFIYRRVVG